MNKVQLLDKYPVYVEEILKDGCRYGSASEVIGALQAQVASRPAATLIGVFDHHGHVKGHPEGKIADGIRDSKHLMFCLSDGIPNPLIAAVRPRAISVVELDDRFVISFLEAPVDAPNKLMAGWIEGLRRQ